MAVVKEDYYLLCNKDTASAAILNYFEYLANGAIAANPTLERAASVDVGSRPIPEFQAFLLGIITDRGIRLRLKKLEESGFISSRGITGLSSAYTVHLAEIQSALDEMPPLTPRLNNRGQTTGVKQPRSNNQTTPVKQPTEPRLNDQTSIYKNDLKEREEEPPATEDQKPESEPATNTPPVNLQTQNGNTDKPKGIAEDKSSAAPPQSQDDFEIEARQWLCHVAPWRSSLTEYRDEMLEAVFQANRDWYQLESGKRNDRKIEMHLRKQEQQAQSYNGRPDMESTCLGSRGLLLKYWGTAQAIATARNQTIQNQAHQPVGEFAPPPPHVIEQLRKKRHAS